MTRFSWLYLMGLLLDFLGFVAISMVCLVTTVVLPIVAAIDYLRQESYNTKLGRPPELHHTYWQFLWHYVVDLWKLPFT